MLSVYLLEKVNEMMRVSVFHVVSGNQQKLGPCS